MIFIRADGMASWEGRILEHQINEQYYHFELNDLMNRVNTGIPSSSITSIS